MVSLITDVCCKVVILLQRVGRLDNVPETIAAGVFVVEGQNFVVSRIFVCSERQQGPHKYGYSPRNLALRVLRRVLDNAPAPCSGRTQQCVATRFVEIGVPRVGAGFIHTLPMWLWKTVVLIDPIAFASIHPEQRRPERLATQTLTITRLVLVRSTSRLERRARLKRLVHE